MEIPVGLLFGARFPCVRFPCVRFPCVRLPKCAYAPVKKPKLKSLCATFTALVATSAQAESQATPDSARTSPPEAPAVQEGARAVLERPGPRQRLLSSGAKVFQELVPLQQFSIHLAGIHPLKEDRKHQMLVHHLCQQLSRQLMQCVLFDSNANHARLNGIEYIIDRDTYDSLPQEEKKFWHPHNFEILSGVLVAPGLPGIAEKEALREKMNSYGKTWHVWDTGAPHHSGTDLPLGPAKLGWALEADGEANPKLTAWQEKQLNINIQQKRKDRADLKTLVKP